MPDEFGKKITPEQVQAEYQKMLGYNTAVNLDETVRANENFFIGKQWEGVDAKGLPTPVYNFLKQVVLFSVANITTDNIKMQATPLACERTPEDVERVAEVVNKEFDRLFEFNRVPNLVREYMRNAAVDGSGTTRLTPDSAYAAASARRLWTICASASATQRAATRRSSPTFSSNGEK